MKPFVLTAIGKDRPGIVSGVTEVLFRHRLNIEDSSMTILEDEFAMIMLIAPQGRMRLDKIQKEYKAVEKRLGLNIQIRELKSAGTRGQKTSRTASEPFIISLLGKDQPGLVYRVCRLLARRKINITDLNTKLIGNRKKPVYAMVIEIACASKQQPKRLASELKQLAHELHAEISLKPVDFLPC